MEKTITSERHPIKLWLTQADDGTIEQARNLANLPFVHEHVCLMPDAHAGYGMPIGGVLAADNVIVPNAVGVDIGCGMIAVQTHLREADLNTPVTKSLLETIRKRIPLGFNHHPKPQDPSLMPEGFVPGNLPVVNQEYASALRQIGTLGGGNHFIEIQKDEAGVIWIMVHSGSRNIGLKVAEHYNKVAKELDKALNFDMNPKADLAWLPFDTPEARDYFDEMNFCVAFALANRSLMLKRILEVFGDFFPGFNCSEPVNIAHNYAVLEEHYGKMVIVHRKGATSARAGETGIIPGSQGTSSYIVEGLGNPESFMSCSHGAGRVMSRNEAIRSLDLEAEKGRLDALGILHSIRSRNDLEEASSAYKDIDTVMALQTDLVRIKVALRPLAVIKG
jgi:tRNA-splicing ligase RtcB